MKRFENQKIVVTGASEGLGRTIAVEMAVEGADLVLVDRVGCEETFDLIARRGLGARCVQCDISREEEVVAMAREVGRLFGGHVDVLINNAGLNGKAALIRDMKLSDWNTTLGVDLTGTMMVCREFIPMLGCGAKIVNVASNVGKRGLPWRSDYVCSKWGVIGFTQTLALELVQSGVRVNAVCPGPIEGERIEQLVRMHAEAEGVPYERMLASWMDVPMKRFIRPEEVSEVIKFLASDASSAMTGQSLNVTGGMLMN